ncbi:hypothetical protein Ahy_B10g104647 [Arachis hypogaea]|uniref:Uncharacterized protein n=1 Tax=Arachis hypogaea TaxID=3818 RepID=A0A444X647_ARAHY|nr:hypothetical protein Ahy_B10g104647 [Arachis hypogaea]
MAKDLHTSTQPWILDTVPLIVVILIGAHVVALISHSEAASAEEKDSLNNKCPKLYRYDNRSLKILWFMGKNQTK